MWGWQAGSLRPSWEHSGGRGVAWQAAEDDEEEKGQLSSRGRRIRFRETGEVLGRAKEWHGALVVCYVSGIRDKVGNTELKRYRLCVEGLIL